eukprot:TRINITY_DN347_c0_g1_i1.p1 TRINITY_DN347_c0_g1~~TRINITY_DN347_c0_g1_i1.p1  ORF type:complete len:408 (+),score=157.41 TRINITY_DN347_c0_g1_i1:584-1807(+)
MQNAREKARETKQKAKEEREIRDAIAAENHRNKQNIKVSKMERRNRNIMREERKIQREARAMEIESREKFEPKPRGERQNPARKRRGENEESSSSESPLEGPQAKGNSSGDLPTKDSKSGGYNIKQTSSSSEGLNQIVGKSSSSSGVLDDLINDGEKAGTNSKSSGDNIKQTSSSSGELNQIVGKSSSSSGVLDDLINDGEKAGTNSKSSGDNIKQTSSSSGELNQIVGKSSSSSGVLDDIIDDGEKASSDSSSGGAVDDIIGDVSPKVSNSEEEQVEEVDTEPSNNQAGTVSSSDAIIEETIVQHDSGLGIALDEAIENPEISSGEVVPEEQTTIDIEEHNPEIVPTDELNDNPAEGTGDNPEVNLSQSSSSSSSEDLENPELLTSEPEHTSKDETEDIPDSSGSE